VEKFVSTPELISESSIGATRSRLGQVWAISPGGQDEAAGCTASSARMGPGGVKILNRPAPTAFVRA
jgi:ATP-dependent Lon protease